MVVMRLIAILLLSLLILGGAAHFRSPEYDEAYSIFLTSGDARPAWPDTVFHPAEFRSFYQGDPSPAKIAADLRQGDVHPPLYFWLLEYWRRLFGPGWFAARMLSVLFSLGCLACLGWVAGLAEIPVLTALLFTLFSYGFAYTGIIARGFALAQMLNIFGIALILSAGRSPNRAKFLGFTGGLAFGAAGFSNYLAVFIGLATLFWLALRGKQRGILALAAAGFILFLPAMLYFFAAQRHSRLGQFDKFSPPHAIALLAKDCGAAIFGGLPVYAGQAGFIVTIALIILTAICAGFVIKKWKPKLSLFALAAGSVPLGLLALGLALQQHAHRNPLPRLRGPFFRPPARANPAARPGDDRSRHPGLRHYRPHPRPIHHAAPGPRRRRNRPPEYAAGPGAAAFRQ